MNLLQFISLMNMIYGKRPVDIKKIQEMGLLAVKIGQVHALRLDFLDRNKCEKLTELYRHTISIPGEEVLKEIDKSHFKYISEKPLASASIGQVHLAELNAGEKVVIKIVKKNFRKRFASDVESVKKIFRFIIYFYPKLSKVFNPLGILGHIEEYTLKELDLRNEIAGYEILKAIYEKNISSPNLINLKFPKIYGALSNEKILVSEYLYGKTFDELLENKELKYETLLEFFKIQGFYIFNVGTFHGDIHPGNMILQGKDIYFIDTGAIGYVSEKIRKGLFGFFKALCRFNYEEAAKALSNMSEIELDNIKYDKFLKSFYELYRDFEHKTVKEASLTRKMMETIKLGVNSGMRFEDGMFPVIKSFMFLDGMVLRCNPDAMLLADMRPYIDNLR